jgi:uncharacterized membrane protein YphA (DoxX/SURF4 family)
MDKVISNIYFLFILRIFLALIFIFAGIEKIGNPINFSIAISNYKLFPLTIINFSAVVIPWIEIISGILLMFGVSVKENAVIITSLLFIFTILIIISLFRGLNIDCGCFGTVLGSRIGLMKVGENILQIISGLLLIKYGSSVFSLKKQKL